MTDHVQIEKTDTPVPANPSASPSTQPITLESTTAASDTNNTKPGTDGNTPDIELEAPSTSAEKIKAKPKGKSRKTKARPRRRVASSDVDSGSEDGGAGSQSDGSLTDASSGSDHDDDDDEEEEEEEEDAPAVEKKATSVFQDASKVQPAGFAQGEVAAKADEVTFDEFNRGEAGAGDSKAKGGRPGDSKAAGPSRELTDEAKAKIEEAKKRRKEKQKAKRAELKEIKRKEREANAAAADVTAKGSSVAKDGSKASKGKGKAQSASTHNHASADSAVPLTADGSPPSSTPVPDAQQASTSASAPSQRQERRNSRSRGREAQLQAQKAAAAADPRSTPRVGGFWTHDQRLQEPAGRPSDHWSRGRGVPRGMRGGFRGRGRGGFGFGAGAGGSLAGPEDQANELLSDSRPGSSQGVTGDGEQGEGDGPERVLAMDREEREVARKEKKAAAATASASTPADEIPQAPKEKKWGHEGFESIQTQDKRKANPIANGPAVRPPVVTNGPVFPIFPMRGGLRGRGRGRGGFIGRGGFFAPPFRPPHFATPPSAASSAQTKLSTPSGVAQPTPESTAKASTPSAATTKVPQIASAEEQSTMPDADSLLEGSGPAVTVRLPGSSQPVEVAVDGPAQSPSGPSVGPSVKTPEINANGQAILYSSTAQSASQPVSSAPITTAIAPSSSFSSQIPAPSPSFPAVSENGSIGSAGAAPFVPQAQVRGPRPALGSQSSASGYGIGSEFYPSNRSDSGMNGGSRSFYPAHANINGVAPRAYPVQGQQPHQQQQPGHRGPPVQPRPQPFYPQHSYNQETYSGPPSQRGSFSGPPPTFYPSQSPGLGPNGYVDGRVSPYSANLNGSPNPYAAMGNQVPGYFAPARSAAKINIRNPTAGSASIQSGLSKNLEAPSYASLEQYPQEQQLYYGQQAQGMYNPYGAGAGGDGYVEGQGYYMTAGGDAQGQGQGQMYAWDGQGGQMQGHGVGYGYEGEYSY
ncbi:hypothetical protein IAU59_001206 [Kwoniella sp. CBS 9459]